MVDPVMLWKAIFNVFCVCSTLFLACEIGQRFTDLFEDITVKLERLNWYLFPLKMQQLLPTIMVNAQEEFVIGSFGIIDCSRAQFKEVNLIVFGHVHSMNNFEPIFLCQVVKIVYKLFSILRKFYN